MPMSTLLSLQNSSRQLHAEIGDLVFKINVFDITGLDGLNLLWALPWSGRWTVKTIRLILPRGGPIFSSGFDLRFPARFQALRCLPALEKIEAGYQMPGIGISTQGVWWIQQLIWSSTWRYTKTAPSYSRYRKSSTPLKSALRHGEPKKE